jgi:hypothetical protein
VDRIRGQFRRWQQWLKPEQPDPEPTDWDTIEGISGLLDLMAINCLRHSKMHPSCPECTRWRNNRDLVSIAQERLETLKNKKNGE